MRVKAVAAAPPGQYTEGGRSRVLHGRLSPSKLELLYSLLTANRGLVNTVRVDQKDVVALVDETRAWRELYGDLHGLRRAQEDMALAVKGASYEEAQQLLTRIEEVAQSIKRLESGLEDLYRTTQQVGK